MSMTYLFHDGLEAYDTLQHQPAAASQSWPTSMAGASHPPKLTRPGKAPLPEAGLIDRPRLTDALARAHDSFAVTQLTGRAGTGKTSLAAQYAEGMGNAAWLALDTPDVEWSNFAAYFMAAVGRMRELPPELVDPQPTAELIDRALTLAFGRSKARLVVLDDLHKICDTAWFGDLITRIPAAVPAGTHVILISRTR